MAGPVLTASQRVFELLRERRHWIHALWLIAGVLAFAAGFTAENLTVRHFMIAAVPLAGLAVMAVPYRYAVAGLFAYLGVVGALKILSGYHPLIHVSVDALVLALCGRWFLERIARKERVFREHPPLTVLFAIHAAWFVIEFFNPYSLGLYPSLAGAKVYLSMLLLFAFGYYLVREPEDLRLYMSVWVAVALLQTVTIIYQGSLGPESLLSLSPRYGAAMAKYEGFAFRPFGTTATGGGGGVYITLSLSFVVYFILKSRSWIVRTGLMAAIPLMIYALTLCQIRTLLVQAAMGLAVFSWMVFPSLKPRAKTGFIATAGILAALLAVTLPVVLSGWAEQGYQEARAVERLKSIFSIEAYAEAREHAGDLIVRYARKVPFGAGLSRTGSAANKFRDRIEADPFFPRPFYTDNFWAATIADVGIPGSLILTILIFTVLVRMFRGYSRQRVNARGLAVAALFASMFPLAFGLWGSEGFLYNPIAAFFWFFGGAGLRLGEGGRLTQ